ncbi:hypothetical protein C0J52_02174, partial [Blattella germanica]
RHYLKYEREGGRLAPDPHICRYTGSSREPICFWICPIHSIVQTGPYGSKMPLPATKPIIITTNRIPKEEAEEGEHLVGEEGTTGVN